MKKYRVLVKEKKNTPLVMVFNFAADDFQQLAMAINVFLSEYMDDDTWEVVGVIRLVCMIDIEEIYLN
jgi:hypothetical protein